MIVFIADIIILLVGLYAVIFGKGKLARRFGLTGWRARVAGLFLVAPLPLSCIIVQSIVILALVFDVDPLSQLVRTTAKVVEWLLLLTGIIGAVVFASLSSPERHRRPTTTAPDLANRSANSEGETL